MFSFNFGNIQRYIIMAPHFTKCILLVMMTTIMIIINIMIIMMMIIINIMIIMIIMIVCNVM